MGTRNTNNKVTQVRLHPQGDLDVKSRDKTRVHCGKFSVRAEKYKTTATIPISNQGSVFMPGDVQCDVTASLP